MSTPASSLDTQAMLLDEAITEAQLAEALARVHYNELRLLAVSQLFELASGSLELEKWAQEVFLEALAEVTARRDRLWEVPSLRAWLASRVVEGCRRLERRERWRRLSARLSMSLPGRPESPAETGQEGAPAGPALLLAALRRMGRRERLSLILHAGLGLSQAEIAWVLKTDLYPVDYWLKESRRKISAGLSKARLPGLARAPAPETDNEPLAAALRGLWTETGLSPAAAPASASANASGNASGNAFGNAFENAFGSPYQAGELTRQVQRAHSRRRAGMTVREAVLLGLVIGALFFTCRAAGLIPKEIIHTNKTTTPYVQRAGSKDQPTPEALFYYYYLVNEGDTLETIAGQAGVRPQDIRSLNRYNYFEDARGLIAGTQILLPAGPAMDWRLTPTPVPPVTPPASLTLQSDPQAVLQRLRESAQTWHTLWASLQQIDYGPPGYLGPPRSRYYQQAWVSQPHRAVFLSSSGELPGPVSIQYFLDGVVFWSSWGRGVYNADYLDEENWFLRLFILFPDRLKNENNLTIQGEATLAGREALIVDLRSPEGGLDSRLWVDKVTGIVLRRVIFSPSSPGIVEWEVAVTAIAYDQDFPSGLYNMEDPLLQGFAQDPSGRPLENTAAFPTLTPWPATGHEPRPYLLAPAGYDPSRQPVFLQWPESWEKLTELKNSEANPSISRTAPGTPSPPEVAPGQPPVDFRGAPEAGIGVFASQYYLGSLPLQEVAFGACRRSPNGRRIALNVRSTAQDNSPGRLYWFDLEAPEKLAEVGGIDGSSNSFVFSPDSRRLAYVTCDNLAACRWVSFDLQTGEETSYNIGEQYPQYLAWRPDGEALVMLVANGGGLTASGLANGLPSYKLLVVDVENGAFLYSAKYDPENPSLPPDSPLLEWGVEMPLTGSLDQGCMNP